MSLSRSGVFLLCLFLVACGSRSSTPGIDQSDEVHAGFVDIKSLAPGVVVDMRYAGAKNFLGRPVAGYEKARCLLSRSAAQALARVQAQLEKRGLSLKVFDCYRPQRAVDDFVAWAGRAQEQNSKAEYYPHVAKQDLFAQGYIAEKSGHSRGSTVDLSLQVLDAEKAAEFVQGELQTGAEVDMGTPYDFFDPLSHTENPQLSEAAQHNRRWLREQLETEGFRNLPEEWWHYTQQPESFPDEYFDFPVR